MLNYKNNIEGALLLISLNIYIPTRLFMAFVLLSLICGPAVYAADPPTPGSAPAATAPQPPVPPAPTATAPKPPVPPAPATAAPRPPVPPAPAAIAPKPPLPPAAPVHRPSARPAAAGGGSSFFFDDADVFEVIQTVFGEALRVNYIIDPSVKGRVNFRTTTPIPRDRILPVMEIILRLNGIAVIEEAGLYRIIPIGNISKEPAPIRFGKAPETVELRGTALMQIVQLTHISSSEMAAIITPLLTQGGAVHDISKRNILIIADTDSNVRRLLQVVATFDIDPKLSTNQPKIYVYSVQNSKAKSVSDILHHVLLGGATPATSASTSSSVKSTTGTSTSSTTSSSTPSAAPRAGPVAVSRPAGSAGSGDTLVAPSTKIYPDEANNSLVILATPADYSVILAAIKQIDSIPRQVMIEAIVASVTIDDNLTFGLKWNAHINANVSSISPLSSNPQMFLTNLGFQNVNAVSADSFGYTIRDKAGNVKVAIEALAANDKAKVLSAPQLLGG